MIELDTSDPCWPYDLAAMFLEASTCCGFECTRRYVADGNQVEAPAPGCPCQLAALVDLGWEPMPGLGACYPRKLAVVTLVLDLCIISPDAESVPGVDAMNRSARENIKARWQILRGLQQARNEQKLGGECGSITPAPWVALGTSGGMARWTTSWRVVTE